VASDLFAKTGPVCAGELCRWPPVNPDLKMHSPLESYGKATRHIARSSSSTRRVSSEWRTQSSETAGPQKRSPRTLLNAWFSTKTRDTRSSHFGRIYRIVVKECYRFLATRRPADNGRLTGCGHEEIY
jgi:hypothetical protein